MGTSDGKGIMRWYERFQRLAMWKGDILLSGLGYLTCQTGFRKQFGESHLPSKGRAKWAASDFPQNSSKESTPKTIEITVSPETYSLDSSLRHRRVHTFWNTSKVVLTSQMKQKFRPSAGVNRRGCIIWGSEHPSEHLEHEQNSECAVRGARWRIEIVWSFFSDEDAITNN
jgi:hypothetical protein